MKNIFPPSSTVFNISWTGNFSNHIDAITVLSFCLATVVNVFCCTVEVCMDRIAGVESGRIQQIWELAGLDHTSKYVSRIGSGLDLPIWFDWWHISERRFSYPVQNFGLLYRIQTRIWIVKFFIWIGSGLDSALKFEIRFGSGFRNSRLRKPLVITALPLVVTGPPKLP